MLQGLLKDQRDAIHLRFFEPMTMDEISRQMGKTVEAVAGLLKRGLHNLGNEMTPESWL